MPDIPPNGFVSESLLPSSSLRLRRGSPTAQGDRGRDPGWPHPPPGGGATGAHTYMYGHEKDHQCGPRNPVGLAACTRYTYLSSTPVFVMTWANNPPSMQEPHPVAGSSSHVSASHLLHRHTPASVRRAPYRKRGGCAHGKRRSSFVWAERCIIQESVRKRVAWMVSSCNTYNRAFCLFFS